MKNSSIQNSFLNYLRKNKILTTIFTTNGFQIRGMITTFDNFTITIQDDRKQNVLYKGAISTISPSKNVPLGNQ